MSEWQGVGTVERVARALLQDINQGLPKFVVQTWEQCTDLARENLLFKARKVLEAMREPTEAMIDAAAATPGMQAASDAMVFHQARGYGFTEGSFDDGSPLHQAWRAMIDAALQEPPQ